MEKATNGQFREFIGKLLVKGNDENVAKIDKTKIQTAINSLSSAEDTVFENLIGFINNGCRLTIDGFVSKLFHKTKIVKVPKNPESLFVKENSIMDFFILVLKKEKELKNLEPWINMDLWRCFQGKTIPGFNEDLVSVMYRFAVKLNQKQILDEAESLGIKKVYTYLEGLSIIRQIILYGEIETKNKEISVYFKVENIDMLYLLQAYRGVGDRLNIEVIQVSSYPYDSCSGAGACFNN